MRRPPADRALIITTQIGTPINYSSFCYSMTFSCIFSSAVAIFREGLERGKYNNSPIIHGLVNISNEFPDDSYLELRHSSTAQ